MLHDYNETRWPVVLVTWQSGPAIERQVREIIAMTDKWCQRGEPYAMILDLAQSDGLTPDLRKLLAAELDQRAPVLAKVCSAAIVITSPVHRGIATVMGWLAPPAHPQRVFASVDEARLWCERQVAKARPYAGSSLSA